MRFKFTKMQGTGNDFVVLDGMRAPVALDAAQCRWIADRRFGVGADQILIVAPPADPARADFSYRIFNADGGEVEQCGNGARAFARYVRDHGYAHAASIRVETLSGVITPTIGSDGDVTVDMGAPRFAPGDVPFDGDGLAPRPVGDESLWPLDVVGRTLEVAVLSMGNPHAVLVVPDVATAAVATLGPAIEQHPRFARRVNAGFMEVVDRETIRLRVYERGAGETLACGTGACAAVVSGIRRGLLGPTVQVRVRGGTLVVGWAGGTAPVTMRGPAVTVFDGEVNVPDAVGPAVASHPSQQLDPHAAPSIEAHTNPSTLEPSPT